MNRSASWNMLCPGISLPAISPVVNGAASFRSVPPRQHHLFLQPLVSTRLNEPLRVLEHVVPGNLLARDFAGRQRRAILPICPAPPASPVPAAPCVHPLE